VDKERAIRSSRQATQEGTLEEGTLEEGYGWTRRMARTEEGAEASLRVSFLGWTGAVRQYESGIIV